MGKKVWIGLISAVFCWSLILLGEPSGDPNGFLKDGSELEKQGKAEEALALYRKGLEAFPSEEGYKRIGTLLGKLKKHQEGIALLEEGVRKFSSSTVLKNLLGLLKFQSGSPEKAKTLWEAVLSVDPNNSFAKSWVEKVSNKGGPSGNVSAGNLSSAGDGHPMGVSDSKGKESSAGAPVSLIDDSAPLSPAEQEKLAEKIYVEMSQTDDWDLESLENSHRTVIRKCPSSKWAEESCWSLSNLYLNAWEAANGESNFQGAAETLEHLIKRYPESPLVGDAKVRLRLAYENLGQTEKLLKFFEERFAEKPDEPDPNMVHWKLGYADALEKSGKAADARKVYEEITQSDRFKDGWEKQIAVAKLNPDAEKEPGMSSDSPNSGENSGEGEKNNE